jgi:hypothetical protein
MRGCRPASPPRLPAPHAPGYTLGSESAYRLEIGLAVFFGSPVLALALSPGYRGARSAGWRSARRQWQRRVWLR